MLIQTNIHARYTHTCKWWNEFLLNNEESQLRVDATKWQQMSANSQVIRIKVSTYIQRNYNNNL